MLYNICWYLVFKVSVLVKYWTILQVLVPVSYHFISNGIHPYLFVNAEKWLSVTSIIIDSLSLIFWDIVAYHQQIAWTRYLWYPEKRLSVTRVAWTRYLWNPELSVTSVAWTHYLWYPELSVTSLVWIRYLWYPELSVTSVAWTRYLW